MSQTTKKAKVNVFRDGTVWCQATWIDGEFDASGPMGIDDGVGEEEAMETARASLARRYEVEVCRVEDIDSSR
jgi:hypothetical protein